MYKLFYQDEFITESENKNIIWDSFTNHIRNTLKIYPHYYRLARLDDHRVMIDFGSHHTFYYVLNTLKKERFEIGGDFKL
jgi:hypothetical protein